MTGAAVDMRPEDDCAMSGDVRAAGNNDRGAAGDVPEVYLDNAATTPMYPQVVDVVAEAMRHDYGNPSSQHEKGREARRLLEQSRQTIADALGADTSEICFTSGATESNNLAIQGVCLRAARHARPGTIVTSSLEHASVTKPVRAMRRSGWRVEYIDAPHGDLDLVRLESTLATCDDVGLVSIMMVQNELGYRFPMKDVAALCRRYAPSAPLHRDAVQAFGRLDVDVADLDCDLLTCCSHKIGGPKGIGALYVRDGVELFSTALGGGQEGGLRSGTQSLPLAIGFAEAVRITMAGRRAAYWRACHLRDMLATGLAQMLGAELIINSRDDGSPFIFSFTARGTDNRRMLELLSAQGVYVSLASACESNHRSVPPGTWRKKHPLVLQLAGIPLALTTSTYRLSFSPLTTEADIARFLEAFRTSCERLRSETGDAKPLSGMAGDTALLRDAAGDSGRDDDLGAAGAHDGEDVALRASRRHS